RVAPTRHFQCRTFGHSATPPHMPERLVENWRRGEDLNPRGTYAPIRFRVGRLQPGSATPPRQFIGDLDLVTPWPLALLPAQIKFSPTPTERYPKILRSGSLLLEELGQARPAVGALHPPDHDRLMVQAPVLEQPIQSARGAVLGIGGAVDEPPDARVQRRPA